ncbi:max dimerization protein 3-like [Huso huso]|uniref:Max dimerization protein 3 n=1 Tax=Huso huso TaxID=61971 RepID=A0ABR0YTL2_HUSHU
MEMNTCNIQVLLQAAEYLERREREAEHGYASASPFYSKSAADQRSKQKSRKNPQSIRYICAQNGRSPPCRRAQLRRCLEQLKQQVPLSAESSRNTTLNLLRRARLHIKKLQEQDKRAERMKDRLRWEQSGLRGRLEQLLGGTERTRNDSLGSALSSERSDSDQEDVEIDVESTVFVCVETEGLGDTQGEGDHSYSSPGLVWL